MTSYPEAMVGDNRPRSRGHLAECTFCIRVGRCDKPRAPATAPTCPQSPSRLSRPGFPHCSGVPGNTKLSVGPVQSGFKRRLFCAGKWRLDCHHAVPRRIIFLSGLLCRFCSGSHRNHWFPGDCAPSRASKLHWYATCTNHWPPLGIRNSFLSRSHIFQ